jgi:hypothetical protein
MTIRTLTLLACAGLMLAGPKLSAADAANAGFLYGTVETDSGNKYTGFIRWGTEEAFWDDHFNSTKDDLEYERRGQSDDRDRERIKIFGVTIGFRDPHGWHGSRVLTLRYGDISKVEPSRSDRAKVTLKNGRVMELDGGSNDMGATIAVLDAGIGEVKVRWNEIESIVFAPAPAGAEPPATRLYGKVKSRAGDFQGFVQWDLQECLSTDELDGESDDGDMSIEMGRIKAIEKRNRNGAYVELRDGRRLLLEDTNDVDDSIDGIFVEDERFGRVELDWDTFERVDFEVPDGSGRGYDDYRPAKELTGKVTDEEGRSYTGRIVFDMDESETWEMLQGDLDDVEYNIPFEMIKSVAPASRDSSYVVLKNGQQLELEDSQDVSYDNDGVLIIAGGEETFVSWRDVKIVEFD